MVILPSIRRKYMASRIPKGTTMPMSACVVTLASDYVAYSGQPRTIGVTVTWEGATLTVNTDYTLSYANNKNLGPATVTVTGMGQFSGSVTKTFYIVSGSNVPWTFDITKTSLVGSCSYSCQRVLVSNFNDNYDGNGNGFFAVAMWQNNSWLRGFKFPRDGNGEFHVENLDMSSTVSVDAAAVTGYQHAIEFSLDGKTTYWVDNGSSASIIKQKTGSTAFSLSGMTYSGDSPDLHDEMASGYQALYMYMVMITRSGRYVFVKQPNWTVHRYTLGTPFDISTLDVSSKSVQRFLNVQNNLRVSGICFNADGSQAIVGMDSGYWYYHVSLSSPYDLSTATEIGKISLGVSAASMCVLNGGKTLLVGNGGGVFEYSLTE